MSLLTVVCTVVFVFYNLSDICCLSVPEILTARDFLTTDRTKTVEIVTPVPQANVILKEEILPSDMIHFPTEMPHFSSEKSTTPTEFSILPKEENKTTPKPFANRTGHRIPRFFGRLALLAGLGLAGLANAASSINLDSRNPQTFNLPPVKLNPFFAAVYEPFSIFPYPYLYSNLFAPFQKPQPESNILSSDLHNSHHEPILNSPDETEHEVTNEEFHEEYVAENRKNDNTSMEGRINNKEVMEQLKMNYLTTETISDQSTSTNLSQEEIEENEESEESTEASQENQNFELFTPTTEQPPKRNKPQTSKPPKQNKVTTIKPKIDVTTKRSKTTEAPDLNNSTQDNSTNLGNTTQPNIQNTTQSSIQNTTVTYPYFHGYYDGNPQIVHDLYLTTSENPPRNENYNDISAQYFENGLNNRFLIESNFHEEFPHLNHDVQASVVEEPTFTDETHFFRGSQILGPGAPPNLISSGFRPSFYL